MSLRRFFRLLLDKKWQPPVASVDDSLAKTAKDAIHLGNPSTGGYPMSGVLPTHQDALDHIAKGSEEYAKSFKKKG